MPPLPPELVAAVLTRHPSPVADALRALVAADSAHEQRDRIVECFRACIRVTAIAALALRLQPPSDATDDRELCELLTALSRRALTDGQWVALLRACARGLGACDEQSARQLRQLVRGSGRRRFARVVDDLLQMRRKETVAHGATGDNEEVRALLALRLPALGRLLEALTPLWRELAIAVPLDPVRGHQRALLLCGETPRQHRWQRLDLCAAAAPFAPVLIASDGRPVARLEPWARVVPDADGQVEALWCIEGNGAHVWLPCAEVRRLGGPVAFAAASEPAPVPAHRGSRSWSRVPLPAAALVLAAALLASRRSRAPVPASAVAPPIAAAAMATAAAPAQPSRVEAFEARRMRASRELLPPRKAWIGAVARCADAAISGDADGAMREWDLGRARQRPMPGHDGAVLSIACSPDGTWVASGGADGTVRLWNRARSEGYVLRGHEGWVESVAFSHDGRWVASGGRDHTVRLWDVASEIGGPHLHRVLSGHRGAVSRVRFSSDDDEILSAGADATVRVWDRRAGRARVLRGARAPIADVDVGPANTVFAVTRDGQLWQWDRRSGRGHQRARHGAAFVALALTPAGMPVIGAADGRVLRWSGDRLEEVSARSAPVTSLVATEEGAVAGYGDGVVTLHRTATSRGDQLIATHVGAVGAVVATRGGVLSGSATGQLVWWSDSPGDVAMRFGSTAVAGLATGAGGVVVAGARGLSSIARDGSGTAISSAPATALASAGETIASGDGRGQVVVRRGGVVVLEASLDAAITWVGVARGGGRVAAVTVDGVLHQFEPGRGRVEAACGSPGSVAAAAFGPGEGITIADWDGVLYQCDGRGQVARRIELGAAVRELAWSEDGARLAAGGPDGEVRVWGRSDAAPRVLAGHTDEVTRILFTPAGDVVTSSRDGTVRVWDVAGGASSVLRGHVRGVTALAIDAGRLVSADDGGTVIFWGERLPE